MNIIKNTYLFFNLNNIISKSNSHILYFFSFFSLFYYIFKDIIKQFMNQNQDNQEINNFLQSIFDDNVDSNNELNVDSNNELNDEPNTVEQENIYIPCEICMNNVLSNYYYVHLFLCMQMNRNTTQTNTTEQNTDVINTKLDNFKEKVSYLPVLEKSECPICFSSIKHTICDLPCSHSFCKDCIEKWVLTTLNKDPNLNNIPCPLCQKKIKMD